MAADWQLARRHCSPLGFGLRHEATVEHDQHRDICGTSRAAHSDRIPTTLPMKPLQAPPGGR